MKLNKVENNILFLYTKYPYLIDIKSTKELVWLYWCAFDGLAMKGVMTEDEYLSATSYETITRVARKVKSKYALETEDQKLNRYTKMNEFREYARQ